MHVACPILPERLKAVGGVYSDKAVRPGDVAQWSWQEEVGQETGKGRCVVMVEEQLTIHRLDTDLVTS